MQWPWIAQFDPKNKSFRAARESREGKKVVFVYMARAILGLTDPKIKADHHNHDTLDNTFENLRPCTHHQNTQNKKTLDGRLKGIYQWRPGTWRARLRAYDVLWDLGCNFPSAEAAARAYDEAAQLIFGEFAHLNFP